MSDRLMSTGDVAEVLGVSEATVKRWADAETLSCIRTPGGHRKFRLRDIAMHLASRHPTETTAGNVDQEHELEELVGALLVGDVERIMGTLTAAHARQTSMAELADTLLYPAMGRVLEACEAGRCEAFHEHVAINALSECCSRHRASLRVAGDARGRVVVAPAPGEKNDVLARLATLVAVENGYDAFQLGTGLSSASIARAAEDLGSNWVLCVSTTAQSAAQIPQFAAQILGSTARSRARFLAVGHDTTKLDGMPEDCLLVRELRDMERILAPVALRVTSP